MPATEPTAARRVPRWAGPGLASAAVLAVVVALSATGGTSAAIPGPDAAAASAPAESGSPTQPDAGAAVGLTAGADQAGGLRGLTVGEDDGADDVLVGPRAVAEQPGTGNAGNGNGNAGTGNAGNGNAGNGNGGGVDNPGQGVGPPLFGDLPVERRGRGERGRPAPDVEARVVSTELVTASGTGVGQVQREALMVTIEIVNSGGGRLALDTTTVTAFTDEGTVPASPVDNDERTEPFPRAVLPHRSVQGTFLFTLPPGAGSPEMSVALMYDLDSPVTVFEGLAPTDD